MAVTKGGVREDERRNVLLGNAEESNGGLVWDCIIWGGTAANSVVDLGSQAAGIGPAEVGGKVEIWIVPEGGSHFAFADDGLVKTDGNMELLPNSGAGFVLVNGGLSVATSASIAQQAVSIAQNDTDQPFIDFQGNTGANATASVSTLTVAVLEGYVQIEINGTKKWIAYYADPSA